MLYYNTMLLYLVLLVTVFPMYIALRVIDSTVSRLAFTANQGQSPLPHTEERTIASQRMCFQMGGLCVPNYAYSYVNGGGQHPAFGGSFGSIVGNR